MNSVSSGKAVRGPRVLGVGRILLGFPIVKISDLGRAFQSKVLMCSILGWWLFIRRLRICEMLLPEVGKTYKLSSDPNDRGLAGLSSGGIAAFTAASESPDAFRRVISYVGSYTNLRRGQFTRHSFERYRWTARRAWLPTGLRATIWLSPRKAKFMSPSRRRRRFGLSIEWEQASRGGGIGVCQWHRAFPRSMAGDGGRFAVEAGLVLPAGRRRLFGMTVDTEGHLYVASRAGLQICDAPGRVVAILNKPQAGPLSNVVFAGKELDWIYVTVGDKVFRRHLRRTGVNAWTVAKPPQPRL